MKTDIIIVGNSYTDKPGRVHVHVLAAVDEPSSLDPSSNKFDEEVDIYAQHCLSEAYWDFSSLRSVRQHLEKNFIIRDESGSAKLVYADDNGFYIRLLRGIDISISI